MSRFISFPEECHKPGIKSQGENHSHSVCSSSAAAQKQQVRRPFAVIQTSDVTKFWLRIHAKPCGTTCVCGVQESSGIRRAPPPQERTVLHYAGCKVVGIQARGADTSFWLNNHLLQRFLIYHSNICCSSISSFLKRVLKGFCPGTQHLTAFLQMIPKDFLFTASFALPARF